jgi:hypothetical protein
MKRRIIRIAPFLALMLGSVSHGQAPQSTVPPSLCRTPEETVFSCGVGAIRFRRRDTELAPVRYDGVTYLILQAASEGAGELNYSAVIEPRPDRQFCLPDSFREIRYPASCPIVFAGDWRDRLFLREHRVGRTRPHRISD